MNGKEDVVLLSYEDYLYQQDYIQELETRIDLYTHLAKANEDVRFGRVKESDVVFDEIINELESRKQ